MATPRFRHLKASEAPCDMGPMPQRHGPRFSALRRPGLVEPKPPASVQNRRNGHRCAGRALPSTERRAALTPRAMVGLVAVVVFPVAPPPVVAPRHVPARHGVDTPRRVDPPRSRVEVGIPVPVRAVVIIQGRETQPQDDARANAPPIVVPTVAPVSATMPVPSAGPMPVSGPVPAAGPGPARPISAVGPVSPRPVSTPRPVHPSPGAVLDLDDVGRRRSGFCRLRRRRHETGRARGCRRTQSRGQADGEQPGTQSQSKLRFHRNLHRSVRPRAQAYRTECRHFTMR